MLYLPIDVILQLLSLTTFNAQHLTVTAGKKSDVNFPIKSKAVLVAKYSKMWNVKI